MQPETPRASHAAASERLQEFMQRHLFSDDSPNTLMPAEFPGVAAEYLEGWEPAFLSTHLFVLLIRGVSIGECVQYARAQDLSLPFRGCEKPLFDLLLTKLHERIADPSSVARVVELMTIFLNNIFTMMKQEIGTSPLDVYQAATEGKRS